MPTPRSAALITCILALCCIPAAAGQAQPDPAARAVPESQAILQELRKQAEAVRPHVETDLARKFLDKTSELPEVEPRRVLRDPETREAFSPEEAAALPEERRAKLVERTYGPRFYYTTGYGSPMIYARMLDVLCRHGVESFSGRKVMDFGYGMIGQERMFASMGAEVHGVEVEPVLRALYAHPGDTGRIDSEGGEAGSLALHHGRWPAEERVVRDVGGGYDIIMSKNTLKRGYIHPAREVDPRFLVDLGVTDEAFLKAVHEALKPGGLFLVYNISPKQNPEDKPYLPHADGLFPFDRKLVESAGFEVVAWDEPDHDAMLNTFIALGYDQGKGEAMREELFTFYTVLRRK